mgnify:CR=1 FL=1
MTSKTVMGVDTSTKGVAFCIVENGKPVKWGKVEFEGSKVFERLADGQQRVKATFDDDLSKVDEIWFESAVFIQSKKTVVLLAMALGAIMSALVTNGAAVNDVPAIAWQNFIGNKAFTKAEKAELKKQYPDRSDSWRSAKMRSMRKDKTKAWALETFGINVEDDDVSDAMAIAYYGWNKANDS